MGGTPVLWGSFAHHDGNLIKDLMHFMAWRRTDNIEKSFSAMILTLKKLSLFTNRLFSVEVSFLFIVVSGDNTEKNMEAYEQVIKDTRGWLREVCKLASEVYQQQLARLEAPERVLQHIKLQNEPDTRNETYQRVFRIIIENIVLSTREALISKATHNIRQGKSDLSEILPKFGEIEGYLEELKSKNNEIGRAINQIKQMVSYLSVLRKSRLLIQNARHALVKQYYNPKI